MVANRIKGITVEIGGDTTKLQTALKGVNTEIRNTQSQLRDVEKLLKLDPGNTELLAQRHRLLGQAVSETKEKLETLKTAAEQANTALANGEISQEQYDALQREIIETENALRNLEQQANQSATAVQKIAASGEKLQTLGDNISSVGKKFLPVTGAVVGFGTAAVKTAADFDSAMSQVAAVSGATGADLEVLRDKAREMGSKTKFSASEAAEAIGLMANAGIKSSQAGTSLRTVMNSLAGEVKICGAGIGEVTVATSNADSSMRDLSDILADCRVAFAGLSESEQAAAAEALVGKNAMSGFLALMNAAPADIEKMSGAIANCDGTAAGMAETMQDNLAGQLTILKSQLEELAISFGELLMPSIRMIVGWVQRLVDWLNGMDEGTKKVIMTVALLAAAIGPVLIVIGKVVSAVGTIMTFIPKLVSGFNMLKTAFSALGAVMAANPIILIVAAVAAAVAAIIMLYQKCEWFRDATNAVWAQAYRAELLASSPRSREAVADTAGMVLMYGGEVIDCYYSASNGGVTKRIGEVWSRDYPYYMNKDDPWDIAARLERPDLTQSK